MSRPDWAWDCPAVQRQMARMQGHAGYDLWNAGVPCAEATAYGIENELLGRLLDASVARGEQHRMSPEEESARLAKGEIHIQHRLSDGSLLRGCVFTAPSLRNGHPVLRGNVCVQNKWWRKIPLSLLSDEETSDYGSIQREIPRLPGWTSLSSAGREVVVTGAPSRSAALRAMRDGALDMLATVAAKHIEPQLARESELALKKAAESALLAAWMAS